jgi:hypothetical protein
VNGGMPVVATRRRAAGADGVIVLEAAPSIT